MTEITVRKLAVLAACLLPALAFADAPPAEGAPPAAAAPAATAPVAPAAATPVTAPTDAPALPQWSFGGGIGYGFYSFASSSSFYFDDSPMPAITASLERRLSQRSWFVLGVSGSFHRNRRDIADGAAGLSRDDVREITASAGVRRVLTRRTSPVEVSVVVVAQGGVRDEERVQETRFQSLQPTSTRYDATSWFAGGEVGLAIDRELTEGISLRVASPLVFGSYGRGSIRTAGQPDVTSSNASAGVALAPRLELRLLF